MSRSVMRILLPYPCFPPQGEFGGIPSHTLNVDRTWDADVRVPTLSSLREKAGTYVVGCSSVCGAPLLRCSARLLRVLACQNRPITAAYLVRLQRAAAEEDEDDRGDGGNADGGRIKRRRRGLPRLGAIPDDIGGGSGSGGGGSSSGGSGGFEGGGPPRLEGHF